MILISKFKASKFGFAIRFKIWASKGSELSSEFVANLFRANLLDNTKILHPKTNWTLNRKENKQTLSPKP